MVIYANRSDLSKAIHSFRRDKVSFSVLPLWFEPPTVKDKANKIEQENKRLAELEEEQKEELELRRQQKQLETEKKKAQEEKLRAQHGPQARALAEKLEDAIEQASRRRQRDLGNRGVSGVFKLVS